MADEAGVDKQKKLREFFQSDLFEFAKYVNPSYMYGDIHEEIFRLLQDEGAGDNQLLLIPRGHLKSHCIAVWVAWIITKKPWVSIVYLSANETLCKLQLNAIKNTLDSKNYRKLWPEMVNPSEAKRDKWTGYEFNVDHPMRKAMGTRDYTCAVRTITASNTGLHCDILVPDDIVTDTNAYTKVGRDEVRSGYGAFVGIKNPGAITKAVGTRYHPDDIYGDFIEAMEPILDDEGNIIGEKPAWDVIDAVVEDSGYGNGTFLWPAVVSPLTGQQYGFNAKILAKKKAEYLSLNRGAWFYSQYYNNPNDPSSERVDGDGFQYINADKLIKIGRSWYYDNKKLNISAGMDLAFSDSDNKRADYSAIAVVGIDWEGFIYVLDLFQYKTGNSTAHYDKLIEMYDKWHWRVIKIETNNGGKLIEREIKKSLRLNGKTMRIISKAKGKDDGAKIERYATVLEPRYEQNIVYHKKGGYMAEYEDQLKKARPSHDDLKDAVTDAMEELEIPAMTVASIPNTNQVAVADPVYGGRRRSRRS